MESSLGLDGEAGVVCFVLCEESVENVDVDTSEEVV